MEIGSTGSGATATGLAAGAGCLAGCSRTDSSCSLRRGKLGADRAGGGAAAVSCIWARSIAGAIPISCSQRIFVSGRSTRFFCILTRQMLAIQPGILTDPLVFRIIPRAHTHPPKAKPLIDPLRLPIGGTHLQLQLLHLLLQGMTLPYIE